MSAESQHLTVTPAQAGVQRDSSVLRALDSRFRGNDETFDEV